MNYAEMTQKECKAAIRAQLEQSDAWVERAIVVIYEYQTADEQMLDSTEHYNGVGFSGVDAEFMSSLAKRLQSGRHLTPKQMPWARKRIVRYSGQLMRIVKGLQ